MPLLNTEQMQTEGQLFEASPIATEEEAASVVLIGTVATASVPVGVALVELVLSSEASPSVTRHSRKKTKCITTQKSAFLEIFILAELD